MRPNCPRGAIAAFNLPRLAANCVSRSGPGGPMVLALCMKVSIVVPACNEEKLLGTTPQSIGEAARAFAGFGMDWELIVCDNNSTDRTAELARAAGARVVFEPINQIGRARNAGAAAASGDWLLFIDADSR